MPWWPVKTVSSEAAVLCVALCVCVYVAFACHSVSLCLPFCLLPIFFLSVSFLSPSLSSLSLSLCAYMCCSIVILICVHRIASTGC